MASPDTICALATGPAPSAVAMIRVSGHAVHDILERNFGGLTIPRQTSLRTFKDGSGSTVDECLVTYMPAPNSYTGEDVLEISVHGGKAIVAHALDALTEHHLCRLAEPGEFTRRAFEAGKLDLVEAEGVADAIEAETRTQKDQALRQLSGGLSAIYADWRARLLKVLALLEAAIDFPDEEDAPNQVDEPVLETLESLITDLSNALSSDQVGERIREGFRIAIVGPPNAGKSSLFNYFAGRDAAIVTDIAGTTRDAIEARRIISGAVVWFIDTAGIRHTEDIVEAEGVRRAQTVSREADLRLHVIDGTSPAFPEGPLEAHDFLLFNKVDAAGDGAPENAIEISVQTGQGLKDLDARIAEWIGDKITSSEQVLVTRARHRAALSLGQSHLEAALQHLKVGSGSELVAEDVGQAAKALSNLLGEVDVEDVLGAVFSEFCIGK